MVGGIAGAGGVRRTLRYTTISALEGLWSMKRTVAVRCEPCGQRRGREFLLVHRLFRSHRTGNIIKPEFVRFPFPPRWHYDILRALRVLKWWDR
jgi:hypothetical protein